MKIRVCVSILIICLFTYCSMAQTKNDTAIKNFSGMNFPNFEEPAPGLARGVTFWDTLEIDIQFSDCGEWGGRKERIVLCQDESKSIKARFTMDTVCCNKIVVENGIGLLDDETRVIKIDVTKILTMEDERLVNLFIHRILELKLNQNLFAWNEELINNNNKSIEEGFIEIVIFEESGTQIQIKNSSSDFLLSFYNLELMANTWYAKVRKQLFEELIKGN